MGVRFSTLFFQILFELMIHVRRRLVSGHASHPLVVDMSTKESLFDECAAKFTVPPGAA